MSLPTELNLAYIVFQNLMTLIKWNETKRLLSAPRSSFSREYLLIYRVVLNVVTKKGVHMCEENVNMCVLINHVKQTLSALPHLSSSSRGITKSNALSYNTCTLSALYLFVFMQKTQTNCKCMLSWRQQKDIYTFNICSNNTVALTGATAPTPDTDWNEDAQRTLMNALKQKQNWGVAKNVILFIGDGMGLSTVTTARIYDGQNKGNRGEDHVLSVEQFPVVALSKVSRK